MRAASDTDHLGLRVISYNLHKGLSAFNRRLVVHEVRAALALWQPDLVFLQEVQGMHQRRAQRFAAWPEQPQHEFLAGLALNAVYAPNASHGHGHHGNAILSRFPVLQWHNHDLTLHRLEQRGMLHCQLELPNQARLYACCVHLNLRAGDRRRQLASVIDEIRRQVPEHAPLLLAGDFNDWRREASTILWRELQLHDAFEQLHGQPARSFPAPYPLLSLDRIYSRGLSVRHASLLRDASWQRLSDHLPLFAKFELTLPPCIPC